MQTLTFKIAIRAIAHSSPEEPRAIVSYWRQSTERVKHQRYTEDDIYSEMNVAERTLVVRGGSPLVVVKV